MARILLVEDEAHIANGLVFNMELEGHAVQLLTDGLAAKQLLLDDPTGRPAFDLIILDLMLPGFSGIDLCRALRKLGDYTPILMLTARNSEKDKVHGLQLGADDYVTKPFNLEELMARIEGLLRRRSWDVGPRPSQTAEEDILAFGNVHLDFARFEATVDGQPVKLTPLEMTIMRTFRENEGKVLTRETLLELAWDLTGPASIRTVDNFVMRLRRLFEPDPSNPRHILSVRGAGYKFVR